MVNDDIEYHLYTSRFHLKFLILQNGQIEIFCVNDEKINQILRNKFFFSRQKKSQKKKKNFPVKKKKLHICY